MLLHVLAVASRITVARTEYDPTLDHKETEHACFLWGNESERLFNGRMGSSDHG